VQKIKQAASRAEFSKQVKVLTRFGQSDQRYKGRIFFDLDVSDKLSLKLFQGIRILFNLNFFNCYSLVVVFPQINLSCASTTDNFIKNQLIKLDDDLLVFYDEVLELLES
jgi:hypothetical protein